MDRAFISRLVKVIPAIIFLPIAILLTIAPYLEPQGTINFGENGLSGVREHEGEIKHMTNPLARSIYRWGDSSCHQKASRSFFLHGNQMPVCSRCISIYWGFAIGSLLAVFKKVYIPLSIIFISLIPMGIDGSLQIFINYTSTNLIRPLTGFPPSLLLAMVLVYSLEEAASVPARINNERTFYRGQSY